SKSDYWLSVIATVLNTPVQVPVSGDFGGAFGAARLAIMAVNGAGTEIATMPPIARIIEPNKAIVEDFDAAHANFHAAQTAIRGLT
ncbi:MAG: FGGY-family carbohydrate kinase, partial [Paracoccaceae bacterium]|nr:FGGY-family carbohydrate kinase [Paracoccaceae bacterium]